MPVTACQSSGKEILNAGKAMSREREAMSECMPTLSVVPIHVNLLYLPCPGGGMADAEDLKSSGDFSSCGFDSHPGHQCFPFVENQLPP